MKKLLKILSYLGKAAGAVVAMTGQFEAGGTIFIVSSILKDTINRIGDVLDDGEENNSFNSDTFK